MSENDNFKDLANRAYVSYHQDGIIDILLGAGITGFGLRMVFDSPALIVLSWLPFLLYMPMKTHITEPRFGYVRFEGEQEERTRYTRLLLFGLLGFVLVLGFVAVLIYGRVDPEVRDFLSRNVMVLMGGLAALIMAVAGAATGLKRFYLYAALALLFNVAGTYFPIHEGVATVLLGLTIAASGTWLLVQFLRAYPLPEEGDGRGD